MIEKIVAGIFSLLGVSLGGISFIFSGYKSLFDLFGRIGIGGILVVLAVIILIHSIRESRRNRHVTDDDFGFGGPGYTVIKSHRGRTR